MPRSLVLAALNNLDPHIITDDELMDLETYTYSAEQEQEIVSPDDHPEFFGRDIPDAIEDKPDSKPEQLDLVGEKDYADHDNSVTITHDHDAKTPEIANVAGQEVDDNLTDVNDGNLAVEEDLAAEAPESILLTDQGVDESLSNSEKDVQLENLNHDILDGDNNFPNRRNPESFSESIQGVDTPSCDARNHPSLCKNTDLEKLVSENERNNVEEIVRIEDLDDKRSQFKDQEPKNLSRVPKSLKNLNQLKISITQAAPWHPEQMILFQTQRILTVWQNLIKQRRMNCYRIRKIAVKHTKDPKLEGKEMKKGDL